MIICLEHSHKWNVPIRSASRNGGEKMERRAWRKVRECVAFCCVAATQAKWHNE